jgi:hypothetical protein
MKEVRVSLRCGLRLKGLLDYTWGPETIGVDFVPPDTYRIRIPIKVPLSAPSVPASGILKVGFEGHLVLTIERKLELEFESPLGEVAVPVRVIRMALDGRLKLTLFRQRIPGHGTIKIESSVPFKFDPGLAIVTPSRMWDFLLPTPSNIPRDWGENPPAELQTPLALPEYDFLQEALEIEEAVLPQTAYIADELAPAHHAPYGLIYELRAPACGDEGDPEYEGYHDTAIWTGHFLAAESFRYAAGPSPEVLQRVQFILEGVRKLFQVTGAPGLLARAALRSDSPFDTSPSMCSSTGTPGTECDPGELEQYYHAEIDGKRWCGFGRGKYPTSRDAYIGIMMGMAYAYILVPDPQVQDTIKNLVTAALNNLIKNRWNVRTPPNQKIKTTFIHQFHQQLAILRLGKTVNPQTFSYQYDTLAGAADFAWVPVWGTMLDPIAKYYKFNLSHAAMSILLFLEDDPGLRKYYEMAFKMLRRAIRHHRNAYFNLVRVIVEASPAARAAAMNEPSGFAPVLSLEDETCLLLKEWLVRRDCIPGPRGLPTERAPDPRYLRRLSAGNSLNPVATYTPVGESEPNSGLISKYALPVHKRPGNGMDFVWQRPPFATDMCFCDGGSVKVGAGRPDIEGPALDYLLPFWMLQYIGSSKDQWPPSQDVPETKRTSRVDQKSIEQKSSM